jgi:hypothetical protein
MSRTLILFAALALATSPAAPVLALCGGGTVAQEFREASVVVRARLVAETSAWDDEPSREFTARWGDEGLVSLYRLKVLQAFKGAPPPRVNIYMPHDSAAFYIDPDKDYLLFLNAIPPFRGRPGAAAGAYTVKYACGQSKPWAQVTPSALDQLRRISGR